MRLRTALPWIVLAVVLVVGALVVRGARLSASDAERRLKTHAQAADALRVEVRTRQQKAEQSAATVERLERENEELIVIKHELQEDVQAKAQELEKLQATFQSLESEMKKEIEAGDVRLTRVGGKLQVGLVDSILFSSGQAELSEAGEKVLERLADVLQRIENRQVHVSGHTDNTPPGDKLQLEYPTNWELSVSRATNVVRALEGAGIPGDRLVASGYGPFRPVADNRTARGRARNRRIEILLAPVIQGVKVETDR